VIFGPCTGPPKPTRTMAPMKRPAGARSDPIKNRCKLVREAIEAVEECPERIQGMLCSTIGVTLGAYKANRHPFNDRLVEMIGEVLTAEHIRLTKDVEAKEAAFAELTPAKATRESALEQAKTDAEAKSEALDAAKRAVTEAGATLKEANAALKEAQKAQKAGDDEYEAQVSKKKELEEAQKELTPLIEGSVPDGEKKAKAEALLEVGKAFKFDQSLLSTAAPVLQKAVDERGNFDLTCIDELKAAFASAVANIDTQLSAGAPGKAERATAVEQAEAAKQAAEASQADLKEKAATARMRRRLQMLQRRPLHRAFTTSCLT